MMFEWDENKRLRTLELRDLDFVDAMAIFDGRVTMTVNSPQSGELRFRTTARLEDKAFTVVWTWRGEKRRIISFRRARHEEERAYRSLHG